MSLLMDALKKAEQTKQQARIEPAESPPEIGALSLEPLALEPVPEKPEPEPRRSSLPDLPAHLETLDEQFLEAVPSPSPPPAQVAPMPAPKRPEPPPAAPPPLRAKPQPSPSKTESEPREQEEQAAIRNVFASKQAPERNNKTFSIIAGAITLIAVIGIGVYFWFQLKPGAGTALVATVPRPAPLAPAPAPQAVTAPPSAPVTEAPPVATTPIETVVSSKASASPTEEPTVAAAPKLPSKPRITPVEDGGPIRISRSHLKPNPALAQAYRAFETGDLALAQTTYQKVLKSDPLNIDALHGLAAIAQRGGHSQQAEAYYQRILEADPRDAVAQSALFGLRGQADAANTESRLKSLIAAQPEQDTLHFALGNLQAAGQRWNEAQQAFFKAYTIDPDNPDYLFNLAVSLDHLRQSRLAAQYYNQALAAQDKRPASFDKAQTAVRLRELQP